MQTAPPPPHPRLLWRMLGAYIEATYAMFGAPSEIARKLWFNRGEHKICAAWIGALERFLRRLLFLDALELAPKPALAAAAAEAKTRPRRDMPTAFGAAFDTDDSTHWRAHFVLLRARKSASAHVRAATRAHLINALPSAPLALRLEALIRAYNNREEEAQKLANKLHAHRAEAAAICQELTSEPKRRKQPAYIDLPDVTQLVAAIIQRKRKPDTS